MRALIVCLLLLLAWPAFAQSGDDEATLRALLDEFLAGATVNDRAVHERFWSDDLVYTSAAGLRFGKAEIMAGLGAGEPDADGPVYSADEVRVRVLGETAVITFRLVATDAADEPSHFFNTGVFRRSEGHWQAFTWQATRAAAIDRPETD
ncbi:MAG: nuclear transport factor 2 family protein [Wenzhouxiangella sp.]|nr:nuclear transport factor 2 family protein [Wenzhouxiangella sp.]MCH8477069.1 nuclear transport factor 2 family protein [Wenzhouxiangella sp.]TVR94242.1 MAG: nuclear transport factor 2 family protein [Wenzhouxiangellaceae bacterium]